MDIWEKISDVFVKHGFTAIMAASLLWFVIITYTESVKQILLLVDSNNRLIALHLKAAEDASTKVINILLTKCVQDGIINNNDSTARACLTSLNDSETKQKRRLENIMYERENGDHK